MLTEKQVTEIMAALGSLPAEKVDAARDFILYLQAQYGRPQTIDESDVWTDEDLRDLTAASLNHAATSLTQK